MEPEAIPPLVLCKIREALRLVRFGKITLTVEDRRIVGVSVEDHRRLLPKSKGDEAWDQGP